MPDPASFVTIGVSAAAVAISLYGLWDRRQETRHQRVVRLSQLIDEINALGLDQERQIAETGSISPSLRASYNSRREMLGREAIRTIDALEPVRRPWSPLSRSARSGSSITDSQHRFLAHALHRMGDATAARAHFDRAVQGSPEGSVFRLFALRGFASFEYERGHRAEGEAKYEQALKIAHSQSGDTRQFLIGETYFHWARQAQAAGADADPLLARAEAAFTSIAHAAKRTQSLDDLRRQRVEMLASRVETPTADDGR